MAEKLQPVLFKVTPEVGAMMDEVCGGKTKGGRGHKGGRSWLALCAVHQMLKLPPPEGKVGFTEERLPTLTPAELSRLDRKSQEIILAYQAGRSLEEMVDYLIATGTPTARNGLWSKVRVKNVLSRAIKKAKATKDVRALLARKR
jgi:hypothetical protein